MDTKNGRQSNILHLIFEIYSLKLQQLHLFSDVATNDL